MDLFIYFSEAGKIQVLFLGTFQKFVFQVFQMRVLLNLQTSNPQVQKAGYTMFHLQSALVLVYVRDSDCGLGRRELGDQDVLRNALEVPQII